MSFFSFEYPYLFLLFFPLLYCMYKCREQLKSRYFVHLHLFSAKKSFLKLEWVIKIAILLFLCTALASPIVVDTLDPHNRVGKDIVLALDGSGSMNASGFDFENDVSKGERLSRFEIAQVIASEFIQKREADNLGVVFFGDFAFIASPITYEKNMVVDMLGYLTHGMAGQNTAIGEGIAVGVRAFKHSKAKTKIIILLTDGEHNSGSISPKDAIKMAQEQEIKIYTIGMGNKGEADEALLQKIAQESGGEYFSATSAKELKSVYEKIDALESSKIKSREYLQKEYYYWVLLLGVAALLLFLLYRGVQK